jgi:hypothetical protein
MKRWFVVLMTVALSACAMFEAAGQEASPPPNGEAKPKQAALRYFRVEVPLDHEEEWPLFGFTPYRFPIERAEFDRLLSAVRAAPTPNGAAAVRVASLSAEASLVDDALVGVAELNISSTATEKTLLSLAGGSFAVTSAKWSDGRAADVGATPDGTPVVMVEQAGTLHIEWSLRGNRDADDALHFDMRLPRSENSRLALRLPRALEVTATRGLLAEQPAVDEEHRRWALELGSLPQTQLVVGADRPSSAAQNTWLVQQHCEYVVDDRGLQLKTDCAIRTLNDAPATGNFRLQADAGLHLTSVAVDGVPAEWEIAHVDGIEQILLKLASPSLSPTSRPAATRHVSLTAVGEFPPAAPRLLPVIRPLGVVWQSGDADIIVGSRWQVAALDVSGGRLAELAEVSAGHRAAVQFFEPSGRIKLACDVPAAQTTARSTYVWRFSPDGVEARLLAEVAVASGNIYELHAELAPGWVIDDKDIRVFAMGDSAEAMSLLAERRVVIGPSQLQLTLDAPLAPERPLRLEITARRQVGAEQRPLPMSDLLFARLSSTVSTAPIGLATTTAPYRGCRMQ